MDKGLYFAKPQWQFVILDEKDAYATVADERLKIGDKVEVRSSARREGHIGKVTSLDDHWDGHWAAVLTRHEPLPEDAEEWAKLHHPHDVEIIEQEMVNGVTTCLRFLLRCGCKIDHFGRFADSMRTHHGWNVRTSKGHGGSSHGEYEDFYCFVATDSLRSRP